MAGECKESDCECVRYKQHRFVMKKCICGHFMDSHNIKTRKGPAGSPPVSVKSKAAPDTAASG